LSFLRLLQHRDGRLDLYRDNQFSGQEKKRVFKTILHALATQKLNDAFNVYKDARDVEADNARPINQRPRAAAPSASSSRSIGQGQAAPDGSSPAAASGPAPQPQSHGPAQGTSAASDNNIFSHCILAEDNTSFHNWDAGLQFLRVMEISGKLFELRDVTFTSALPVGKDRTKFSNCVKKVLVLADIFQDSIRARDTLRHLARSLAAHSSPFAWLQNDPNSL